MDRRSAHELVSLIWPWWALMLLATLTPLLRSLGSEVDFGRLEMVAVLGFFGGAAVLSAWVFASERRQSGPAVEALCATEIWRAKAIALAAAVFSAAVVACLVQTVVGGIVWANLDLNAVEPVLLRVVLVCSAAGWASVTRSVMGGLLLSGAALGLLYLLIVAVVTLIDVMSPVPGTVRLSHSPGVHTALMSTIVAVGLGYAIFMLRLGKRKFATMELAHPHAA